MPESKALTETGTGIGSGKGLVDLGGPEGSGAGLVDLGEPIEETASGSGGGVFDLSMIMVRNGRARRSCRTAQEAINLRNSIL